MRQAKASNLITQAYALGTARSIASRIVTDTQALDVAVSPVLGDSASQDLAMLRSAAKRLQDRIERAQIDNVKAAMRQPREGSK